MPVGFGHGLLGIPRLCFFLAYQDGRESLLGRPWGKHRERRRLMLANLQHVAHDLAEAVHRAGGRAFLVGGSVRDKLLGLTPKDADMEVFGLDGEVVESLVSEFGSVHLIGKQFAVLHVSTPHGALEVSLPRRESKTGPGHKGFLVDADPHMKPAEAARRRDFTVNAMMEDPLTGEVIDPFEGKKDLERGCLRHVSDAFSEDPLRVLRASRFAARFGWSLARETSALCRTLDLSELPRERLESEWKDILLHGRFPGRGLLAMEQTGALAFFPELAALRNVPQDPVWHPEGDVLHHTALCLDAAVSLREEMADPWAEMLAILCHDLGKAVETNFERARWRSAAHDTSGVSLTRSLLARITAQEELVVKVGALVREHLRPSQLWFVKDDVSDSAIRRLAIRVDIPALIRVAWADAAGRTMPHPKDWEVGQWLLSRAADLGVKDSAPQPFLRGKDALELGMKPGKKIGVLLEQAFELQLDGKLENRDAALQWLSGRFPGGLG